MEKFKTYKYNPFPRLGLVMSDKYEKVAIADVETGEYKGEYVTAKAKIYDGRMFYKYAFRDVLSLSLSSGAIVFMHYIGGYFLRKDIDTVILHYDAFEKKYKENKSSISERSYYKYIKELVKAKVIARTAYSTKMWYINTNIFFNGDRRKVDWVSLNMAGMKKAPDEGAVDVNVEQAEIDSPSPQDVLR